MLFIQRNKLYYLFIRSKTNNKKPNLKEREREREILLEFKRRDKSNSRIQTKAFYTFKV
jgi:hypothetical protein